MKWLPILLLLVVACAQQPAPHRAEVPTVPVIPQEQAIQPPEPMEVLDTHVNALPSGKPATAASEIRDRLFATRKDGSKALTANDVVCDDDNEILAFRFRNLDTKRWQLNNDVPLQPPADLVGVYVMVNNYQVNDRTEKLLDGRTLFGPNHPFSENCEGVEILSPGEEVVCILYPVPIRDIYHAGGVNEIIVNVPGSAEDPRVEFTC